MTTKSVRDPDFMYWQVRDLDTGELLDKVQYADDSTGFYVTRERSERGVALNRTHKGNIKLEDTREKYSSPPERDELLEALQDAKEIVARLEERIAERDHRPTVAYNGPPPPGRTYIKDGRTIVEVDAIYVVGEGYVYI